MIEPHVVKNLKNPSEEYRAEREEMLLAEMDNRTPVEKLIDVLFRDRMTHYRPTDPPNLRQDIICLCCGFPYRPDNIMDGENMFVCGSCILHRKETEAKE